MQRPVLLDTFCYAGGAAMGYSQAGFEVVGVDLDPQPHYPFRFYQADALQFIARYGADFAAIHASPPCQGYSKSRFIHRGKSSHPMLIPETRQALVETRRPYLLENVPGAPLLSPTKLCGLMFGLKVFRHRLFESNLFFFTPPHPSHRGLHIGKNGMCCVAGHGDRAYGRIDPKVVTVAHWREAMGIDWMTRDEIAQAIPPAYTRFLGLQLLAHLEYTAQTGRSLLPNPPPGGNEKNRFFLPHAKEFTYA